MLAAAALGFAVQTRGVRAETPCPIPDDLAMRDLALPAVRHDVESAHRLTILTLGGSQTAGAEAGDRSATYPARLAAELKALLPGITVSVVTEALPSQTAAEVPGSMPGLLAKYGAKLVIWGAGSGDVAKQTDPEQFLAGMIASVGAIRAAGADVILLDAPYMPSPERMARIEPYRDRILSTAAARAVPLLRRQDLMRRWSEDGTLNLAAHDPADRQRVARRLYACVARGLAVPIAAAVR